jgi:hypothetical protein
MSRELPRIFRPADDELFFVPQILAFLSVDENNVVYVRREAWDKRDHTTMYHLWRLTDAEPCYFSE